MGKNLQSSVVTGYGAITALGKNCQDAFAHMAAGLLCSVPMGERFFPKGFTAPCFQVPSIAPEVGRSKLDERIAKTPISNRTVSLTLLAVAEALHRAGLSLGDLQGKRVGVVLGTTVGCTFHNEDYYVKWRDGQNPSPEPLFAYLNSNLADTVLDFLGAVGPGLVITNACASGTDAIGIAKTWLENNRCDIAIAGGADELSRVACHGFKSLMLYSEKSCTPFDAKRQGLNLGEGAGILVMEKQAHAKARGQEVVGRVRGYGCAGDAYHPTAPHPDGLGLQGAINGALQDSGFLLGDICLINAHGTGTPANDLAETNAISALGFDPDRVPVVSTKGFTGHTLGAAGGVEAVYTLMALNEGRVRGTGGCHNIDPKLNFPVLAESETRVLAGKIGMSQSLAFGGSNSALIIEGVK